MYREERSFVVQLTLKKTAHPGMRMPEDMTPIEIEKKEFQKIGYQLIDRISEFFETIRERPVTNGESPKQLQNIIGMSSIANTYLARIYKYAKSKSSPLKVTIHG